MQGRFQALCVAASFAVLSVGLVGASCDKKPAAGPSGPVIVEPPPTGTGDVRSEVPAPKQGSPYPDPTLDSTQQAHYAELAQRLPSPCGKAHSLAVSAQSDPSCKRTPFAARYVKYWLSQDVPPDQVEELYNSRYLTPPVTEFDLHDTPFEGVPNAPVTIVEFFDYGCGHCAHARPELEDLAAEYPSLVVIYFKHFPLSLKTSSVQAAAAAIAAQKQGKFREMHRKLFEAQPAHGKEDIERLAREIGLEMGRFQKDWADPAVREKVMADRAEGDKLGLEGTPSIFINGRPYSDRLSLADFRDWVNEELAVNQ
jgi:protein-disulfide isomerase